MILPANLPCSWEPSDLLERPTGSTAKSAESLAPATWIWLYWSIRPPCTCPWPNTPGPQAVPYAIKLGVALQITNILRDVGEDQRNGRIYLPAQELAAYGLSAADLAAGRVDDLWRAFMGFQIRRNHRLYDEAWPGISMLHQDGRLAVAAAATFYRAILDDIEANDYDVFNRRAHLSGRQKLRLIPGLWWRNR